MLAPMPRGVRLLLLASLTLVWVGALGRLRAFAQLCLPPDALDRLTLHVTSVARAVGCMQGEAGPDALTRSAVLAAAALLPLLLLRELLVSLHAAGLAAPLVALVRRLVGGLELQPVGTLVVAHAGAARASRGPLRSAVGHSSTWSHRGPPRFV